MKVTIENYTECCLRTWGGENQKERAELGIIGELGEVAEVLKKFLRGDFDKVERDRRLLKELGDLLYYIAVDFYLKGKCFNFIAGNSIMQSGADIYELHEYVLCGNEYASFECVLGFIINSGFNLEQVMQANIDKLTERAEKNVIKGDGSDR
jgi:NTP pyrophosphatase (non-canonical NTP hydrolase)